MVPTEYESMGLNGTQAEVGARNMPAEKTQMLLRVWGFRCIMKRKKKQHRTETEVDFYGTESKKENA